MSLNRCQQRVLMVNAKILDLKTFLPGPTYAILAPTRHSRSASNLLLAIAAY
ncbi:hypothetical protein AB205_0212150 [Aquarana catesbeiana]|uniref:Uncharacterized protein n=1 Tax=Aquarana catesbeiana TaxID=8400 RepID=A0A2G9RK92_AQUCT|nr:hypothetical protein AB205_0212150 [Aquarana catesbeiana]